MPVLAYYSDPGDEFEEEFLHLTSTTREEIQLETCTPSDGENVECDENICICKKTSMIFNS